MLYYSLNFQQIIIQLLVSIQVHAGKDNFNVVEYQFHNHYVRELFYGQSIYLIVSNYYYCPCSTYPVCKDFMFLRYTDCVVLYCVCFL